MTAILDRVPVERITAEARDVHPGRFLLTLIGGLLYAVGWLAAKTVMGAWFVLAWAGTAVKVGWMEARSQRATGRGESA